MSKPYISNDDNMLTVSLMAVQVRETQFDIQVIEGAVFHVSSLKLPIASVMGL